jgi:hypothetical protein
MHRDHVQIVARIVEHVDLVAVAARRDAHDDVPCCAFSWSTREPMLSFVESWSLVTKMSCGPG